MSQIRPKHLDICPLPPFKEVLLEIQVNKLINEILFSDNKVGKKSPQESGPVPVELKENAAALFMPCQSSSDMNVLVNSIGNTPSVNPPRDLHASYYCESLHGLSRLPHANEQRVIGKEHEMCCSSNVKILQSGDMGCRATPKNAYLEKEGKASHDGPHLNRMETFPCLQNLNAACWTTSVSRFLEKEGKTSQDRPHLNRMETFPCTSRMHSLEEDACEGATGYSLHSSRKPPRPPRLPSVAHHFPGLTKCAPNKGFISQKRRKFKSRRRVSRASNTNASICALVFTLCFIGLMIAQGFWHKGSSNAAVKGNNAAFSVLKNYNMNLDILAVLLRTMGVYDEAATHARTKERSDWFGSYSAPSRLRSRRVLEEKNLDPDILMRS